MFCGSKANPIDWRQQYFIPNPKLIYNFSKSARAFLLSQELWLLTY